MEFERGYYRLYERIMSGGGCKKVTGFLLPLMLGTTIFFAIVWIGAHLNFVEFEGYIKEEIEKQAFTYKLNPDYLSNKIAETQKLNDTNTLNFTGDSNDTNITVSANENNTFQNSNQRDIEAKNDSSNSSEMQDVIVWDIDQRGMNCTKWSDILEIRIVRSIADAEYMTKKYEDDFRHNRTINETFKDEGNRIIGYYRFATSWRLSTLPQVIKDKYNFTSHWIFLPREKYTASTFRKFIVSMVSFDPILLNDIRNTYEGYAGRLDKIHGAKMHWSWTNTTSIYHYTPGPGFSGWIRHIGTKIFILIRSFTGYGLMSLVLAFILRVFILASSAILHMYKCFCCRCAFPSHIYRAMPWYGTIAAYLERTGRSGMPLIMAFIMYFVTVNLLSIGFYDIWRHMFLGKPSNPNFANFYSSYIIYLEMLPLALLRTRISIRYFPWIITTMNTFLLAYDNLYFYSFSTECFLFVMLATIFIFLLFLRVAEIPSVRRDPFGDFTPSINNPRCAYMPVQMTNFSIGYDIWTAFYPLSFRSEFQEEEQNALLDDLEPLEYDFSINRVQFNDGDDQIQGAHFDQGRAEPVENNEGSEIELQQT